MAPIVRRSPQRSTPKSTAPAPAPARVRNLRRSMFPLHSTLLFAAVDAPLPVDVAHARGPHASSATHQPKGTPTGDPRTLDHAMSNITVTLPDGSPRELPEGSTSLDLASSIGRGLAKSAVAAVVDGSETDLTRPLHDGSKVAIVTDATEEGRHVLRHSTAHVMAQAVTRLFPGAKYSIGPAIENGFYYDFELPGGATFSDEDLAAIEAEMREIVKADQPFVRSEMSPTEALELFADQPYKREIIERVQAA